MIIALQCCIGFSHTTMWISQKYTYIPYLLNLLPSTPLRLTSLGCHKACDWARWVIQQLPTDCLFYMFQCYSLSSSYSLLPSLCPQARSLGLYLQWCPADKLVITILSWFHICALIYNYIVSLSDNSLCITGSRLIYLSPTDSNAFLFIANIPLYIYTTTSLSTLLSMDI